MNTVRAVEPTHRKAVLSTLWIFVVLNYLYGDLAMMIFNPASYQRMVAGMSDGLVLGATAFMEIFIVMVLLSRVLGYRANRWANIAAGMLATVFVGLTLVGRPPAFYVFLSVLEMATTVFIAWYAWTWRDSDAQSPA